jgi:hypothetical protein
MILTYRQRPSSMAGKKDFHLLSKVFCLPFFARGGDCMIGLSQAFRKHGREFRFSGVCFGQGSSRQFPSGIFKRIVFAGPRMNRWLAWMRGLQFQAPIFQLEYEAHGVSV